MLVYTSLYYYGTTLPYEITEPKKVRIRDKKKLTSDEL